MTLSERATSIWAKSQGTQEWLPLCQHMLDTLHVAAGLYDHWLSRSVRTRWETGTLRPDALRATALFVAAAHDIGKAAPAFVAQHESLAQRVRAAGLPCHTMAEIRDDRRELPHSLIGQVAAETWLRERQVDATAGRALASVIGGHHGRPANASQLRQPRRRPHGVGAPGSGWPEARSELLDWVAGLSGFDAVLGAEELPTLPLPLLVEISGFVIVADWLASNTRLHPLRPQASDGLPQSDRDGRAGFAWHEAAMPPPWEPALVTDPAVAFFADRFFRTLPDARPNPVQEAVFEAALTEDIGMVFVETTTGAGKTEAALAAAEIMAARDGSQGILVALPTQATSNAMFERVADWLEHLPQPPVEVGAWALTLGHGKSMLQPRYAKLARQFAEFDRRHPSTGTFAPLHEDEGGGDSAPPDLCNAVVHHWFLGAKRRLLANFTVVTIDQLLMMALQRKHLMLAHIALSGKVIVIDEAHASDEHMQVYLDSALSWLGAYGAPVIVLSATLTPERRRAMMRSYAPHRSDEIEGLSWRPDDYPLLTILPRGTASITSHVVPDRSRVRDITWSWHPTDFDTLTRTVAATLASRGCAVVIRNTVADAQRTAAALAEVGLPVKLTHAGFLAVDRAANDAELRTLFGNDPDGTRPTTAVVVSTQVVEQSLDVDFDVLFTDVAPMDLLIQRMGRLHRHVRARPHHLETARAFLLADTSADGPPAASDGSVAVYGQHLLLRTMAMLNEHGESIRFPDDIAPLVNRALSDEPIGPPAWQDAMATARAAHAETAAASARKAAQWCVRPWAGANDRRTDLGTWLATTNDYTEIQMGATVRDTQPTIEVLVLPTTPDGMAVIRPPWMSADPLAVDVIDTSSLPSDDVAREIATWSVRLPTRMSYPSLIDQMIAAIDAIPETKRWLLRRHPLLKGELLLPMRQTHEGSTTVTAHLQVEQRLFDLRYSPDRGLEVTSP